MTASRGAIAKLAIARKQIGLDEEAYRAILERLTGHRSATLCSDTDIGAVLDEFKAKGWKPRRLHATARSKAHAADTKTARKARALWISLHQIGAVRDGSEAALESFARRQLKVEKLQWADQGQVYKLIEALKAMATRAGWSQTGSLDEIKGRLQTLIARQTAA